MSLRYKLAGLRFLLKPWIAQICAKLSSSTKDLNAIIGKRIVIISPHPDDEVLGCGGLIMRCIANGNSPDVVILSGGGHSLHGNSFSSERVITERAKLTDKAAMIIGLKPQHLHRFYLEDERIGEEISDAKKINEILLKLKALRPEIIMVPSMLDDFTDHQSAHKLGAILCDTMHKEGYRPELWNYNVWAWYYHALRLVKEPGKFVCLNMNKDELQRKREAVRIYVEPDATTGICWSSHLPSLFVAIHRWKREIYYMHRCVQQTGRDMD